MLEDPKRLRVLVVDDEPMARASLVRLLQADDEIDVVGVCADGEEALAAIDDLAPDLVFLDVQMPVRDGFEVLRALPDEGRPEIVFTTAFARYAPAAFDVEAVDYLLKPFDDERFARALARAKDRLRLPSFPPATTSPAERLTIHREGRVDLVEVAEIDWIEAADQYVRLHTAEGEHLMRESMGQLERVLDPTRFMRVHRSAIVALDRVRRLESRGGGVGRLLLGDGTWVPVSRSRMAAVRRQLG